MFSCFKVQSKHNLCTPATKRDKILIFSAHPSVFCAEKARFSADSPHLNKNALFKLTKKNPFTLARIYNKVYKESRNCLS